MAMTVIGLMEEQVDAQSAAQELCDAGLDREAVTLLGGNSREASRESVIDLLTDVGVRDEAIQHYAEGVHRGGTLILVDADDDEAAYQVAAILREHGAVDIDERAEQWRSETETSEEGEGVLQAVEEELVVGKREVERGGVRVRQSVTETPVEETVELREEKAYVERRPVDRPVQAGDEAFAEKTIELRETAEEAVVSKQARVVEEVTVGKTTSERQQKIEDTVRKSEIEVEAISPSRKTASRKATYKGPERRKSSISYKGAERRVAA